MEHAITVQKPGGIDDGFPGANGSDGDDVGARLDVEITRAAILLSAAIGGEEIGGATGELDLIGGVRVGVGDQNRFPQR